MRGSISSRRGSAMLEFTITTLSLVFAIMSLFWMCMGMLEYHTVAEAVNSTARTESVHGAGCAGQACATTVASTAQLLAAHAIGIPSSQLNVSLTSVASGTISCNPVTSCFSNSAAWPSSSSNTALTTQITISATYQFTSAIAIWAPGGGMHFNPITLGANSTQPIVY